ncbi:hypothetical protein KBA63_03050 [Candidatus Woesebacteria bacterium]|jgi:hypothetical protein|nr:hypothetical protein [Candidatus Woesebacteria bacterium]MBP9687293.1 hypothetical protein [Candidatus Woesebacteria bacterium]
MTVLRYVSPEDKPTSFKDYLTRGLCVLLQFNQYRKISVHENRVPLGLDDGQDDFSRGYVLEPILGIFWPKKGVTTIRFIPLIWDKVGYYCIAQKSLDTLSWPKTREYSSYDELRMGLVEALSLAGIPSYADNEEQLVSFTDTLRREQFIAQYRW